MIAFLSIPSLWITVIVSGFAAGWFVYHSGVMRRPIATFSTQLTIGLIYLVPGLVIGFLSQAPRWDQWLGQIIAWTVYSVICAVTYKVLRRGRGA